MTDLWWKSAVVYQIYPRSFADADGDGMGDLRGIIDHLDHLAGLGVDVIWLSPIYPSPQDDNGYDISDYQDIDPLFGDLDDLRRAARGRPRPGHEADHGPGGEPQLRRAPVVRREPLRRRTTRSGTGTGGGRPATGMEPGTPGAEPTNWGSAFGGSAWEYDDKTGEYYLHLFSPQAARPQLGEPARSGEAVYAMMRWWLDRGVDGFRMDVINMISKAVDPDGRCRTAGCRSAPRTPTARPATSTARGSTSSCRRCTTEVFAGRDALLTVGEMPGVTVDEAKLFTDPARHEVDMVFQFDHVWVDRGADPWHLIPLRLTNLKAIFGRWQAGLADVGWNSLYWNNHDQPRAVSRYGDDSPQYRVASAKMLGTVLHLHRGTPYVYQGEELGMTNYPFRSIADFRDIEALGQYAQAVDVEGRVAGGRADRAAGPRPGQRPYADAVGLLAARRLHHRHARGWRSTRTTRRSTRRPQRDDPDSVYHYYRRLIELRHTEPAVVDGDFTMLLPDDERLYAYTRRLGATELLVIGNFSGDAGPGRDRRRRRVVGGRAGAHQPRDGARRPHPRPVAGRDLSPHGHAVMACHE